MSDFEWLPLQAVIDLHAEQLEEHGGAVGLRDQGALESAVARPQNFAAYQAEASIFRLAAAYSYGLTQNHPFIDGNKRIAFVAGATFLILNGWYLDALESEAERMMVALSSKEIDESAFAEWLEQHSIRT